MYTGATYFQEILLHSTRPDGIQDLGPHQKMRECHRDDCPTSDFFSNLITLGGTWFVISVGKDLFKCVVA